MSPEQIFYRNNPLGAPESSSRGLVRSVYHKTLPFATWSGTSIPRKMPRETLPMNLRGNARLHDFIVPRRNVFYVGIHTFGRGWSRSRMT